MLRLNKCEQTGNVIMGGGCGLLDEKCTGIAALHANTCASAHHHCDQAKTLMQQLIVNRRRHHYGRGL